MNLTVTRTLAAERARRHAADVAVIDGQVAQWYVILDRALAVEDWDLVRVANERLDLGEAKLAALVEMGD